MGYLAFGYLLQFAGISVIASSIVVDFMMPGTQGYGKMQFAITVVGIVVILTGLCETTAQKSVVWNRLLLLVYTAGILYMGLGAEISKVDPSQPILGPNVFSLRDLLINIFGFLPLGYLLASNLLSSTREELPRMSTLKISALALGAGISLSLVIETSQHFFIAGRFSSIYDILGNSLGTIAGVALYYLARKWDMRIAKPPNSKTGFFNR